MSRETERSKTVYGIYIRNNEQERWLQGNFQSTLASYV